MKNTLARSIPTCVRLRFISCFSCCAGFQFLFGALLIGEPLASGSYVPKKEDRSVSCLKSHVEMSGNKSHRYGSRNHMTVAHIHDLRPWGRVYSQNTQSAYYALHATASGSPSATSLPAIKTVSASNVTHNSATLVGIVNAHGLSTTAWFQYRVVNGPSKDTFSTQTVIGTSDTEVSMRIIGLLPATTYYYRIVARNDAGTSYGSEVSFTTIDMHAQTTEITPPVGSVSINNGGYCANSLTVAVNLSATDNTGVTGYYLSTSAVPPSQYTAGWTSIAPTINYKEDVSYTLGDGDGRNTIYVWYKDASGNMSDTASASIVVDTTPPAITVTSPTTDQTYTTANGTITISGSASDDINEITAIAWSNTGGRNETERKTIEWAIPNIKLEKGDNVITVTAMDSVGNTGIATITITYAEANNPPAVITGPATSIAIGLATLTGTVNAMGLPATTWFHYGTSSEHYTDSSPVQSIENVFDDIPVSYRISGLRAGTTYYCRLAAQNSAGTVYGDEVTFNTLPSKGRITGDVVHVIKGEPVESARLRLKGTKARKKSFKITFSQENGFFEFKDLDADTYDISVIKTDFKSTSQAIELGAGEGKKVRINLEKIKEEGKDQSKDVKNDHQKVD